jgi:C-terminal processing protease CtpA/Prc
MKQITCFLTAIILNQVLFAQKLSLEEVKKDFSVFKTALTEAHPGIYRFESKATIDSLFNQTEKALKDSISQQQFYQILSPLVAAMHCGHTKFNPEGIYDENHLYHYYYGTEHLFPLKLYFSGQKAFYVDSFEKSMDFEKGTEITAINGRPVHDLITFLFKNIVADGRVVSSKYLELDNFFSAYYANLVESPQQFNLTLKKKDGELFTAIVPATSLARIREYEKSHMSRAASAFDLSFPKSQVALIRIRAFYPFRKEDNFNAFLKKSFAEIEAKKTKKLIIDLRNNEGGNDRWGSMLFSYLTDKPFRYYESLRIPCKNYSFRQYAQLPGFYGVLKLLIRKDSSGAYRWTKHKNLGIQKAQKHPFLGEVDVLVNGFSFSATAEFAAVAKASGRVKLVGEETGGAYSGNNSGTFVIVTLPYSRLSLGIPMVGYYMAVPPIQPLDRGVLPTIKITPNIQQIISGEDLILERVLEDN